MSSKDQNEEPEFPRKKLFPKITTEQIKVLNRFVPDQLYESETDAIEVTLDLLPHASDPNFISEAESLQKGFIESVDIVSKNLMANLEAKYNDVLKAMNLISDLNNQLNLSTQNISITRQVLQSAESEICDHPRIFFRQIQKQKNLKIVLDLLDRVQKITKSTDQLNQALKNRDFVSALALCLKPAELSVSVRKLTGVENLVSSLHNMYNRVIDKMDTALVAQTTNFERDVYDNLIRAYDHLNQLNLVPQKLQEAFMMRSNAKYDEITALTDYSNVNKFKENLQQFIESSYALLSVHQQIVAWHRGTTEFDSIRKAIEEMAKTIWDSIENDVTSLLKKAPVQKLNFESFDSLLKMTNGFIQFGATVVDMPGGALALAMDKITTEYFKLFHRNSLEAARENLESDTWVNIPADAEFERQVLTLSIPVKEGTDVSLGMTSVNIQSAFQINLSKITNSCSSVIKMLHQYLSMMKAVPSLAVEAIHGIRELVEFYGFCVLYIFLKNSPVKPFEMNQNNKIVFLWQYVILLSTDGLVSLSRIIHHFMADTSMYLPTKSMVDDDPVIVGTQAVSAANDMTAIGWYLESIRSYLEEALPENSLGSLRRFYSDVVMNFLKSFPTFCFQFIVPNMIDLSSFDQQIRQTNFKINEAQIEPHQYSVQWVNSAKSFDNDIIKGRMEKEEGFDEKDREQFLLAFWTYSSFLTLNAFSSVSKCTAEGRTSMVSDFRNMSHEFQEIIGKKVQIGTDWVIDYVNAYYSTKDDLMKWVSSNYKKYTMSQLTAIVETGLIDQIGRKDRTTLQENIKNKYKEFSS
ncbi:hypothetical protein M9Y10_022968 [Tritrichomonas musculus]|uniref:Uncharacterized protein n=1 Tax=Tritrichomonas musculus TaxID=1915356 RepID=A0ABR2KTS9_9EUKA